MDNQGYYEKRVKTSNNNAYKYVIDKIPFQGSNIFALWLSPNIYSVYSYGYHFPMYIYDAKCEKWLGNKDKYSRSTGKHQRQTLPNSVDYWFDTYTMMKGAMIGLEELIIDLAKGERR